MRSSLPLVLALTAPLTLAGCAPARAILDALASLGGASPSPAQTVDTAIDTGTEPVDTGTASVDTGFEPVDTGTEPVDTGTEPVDTAVAAEMLPVVVTGVTVPAPGQTTLAEARYDLTWEGEELSGAPEVVVGNERGTLYAGGVFVESRIGEDRQVSFSLEVPAAGVVAGATLDGWLFYGESLLEPDWLDVFLGSPVTVDVVQDPADPGALVLQVAEAELGPQFGVGVARAGLLYEGPYDLVIDPTPQLACGALTAEQLDLVSQGLEALAAEQNEAFDPARSYAYLSRGAQGQDPMEPFRVSADLVETLTSWNGTYPLQRVPDSGGRVTLDFTPIDADTSIFGASSVFDPREAGGHFEVGRRLTIDGRTWGPGFEVVVERFYADSPDATTEEADCIATFTGSLETFTY